jgi:hypothetical protein
MKSLKLIFMITKPLVVVVVVVVVVVLEPEWQK